MPATLPEQESPQNAVLPDTVLWVPAQPNRTVQDYTEAAQDPPRDAPPKRG